MSDTTTTTARPLMAYMTWSLGIDMPGLSIVYAADTKEALELLEEYSAKAQPKHKLHNVYLPLEVRKVPADNNIGIHLLPVGLAEPGTEPHVFIIERGEDVRFDD